MTDGQKSKLIDTAKSLIGKPYKYGARPEDAPHEFDCSSFVQYVFKQVDIELPRSSLLQASDPTGERIVPATDFANLEIGDLLFMRGIVGHYKDDLFNGEQIHIGHVVMYIGDKKCIHTGSENHGVIIKNIEEFSKDPKYRIVVAKRWL